MSKFEVLLLLLEGVNHHLDLVYCLTEALELVVETQLQLLRLLRFHGLGPAD